MLNDPVFLVGAAVITIGMIAYKYLEDREDVERIDAESFQDRIESIFRDPVLSDGATVKDWIKLRATSTTPTTLGYAVKALDTNVTVTRRREEDGQVEEKDEEIPGTSYGIIQGSSKLGVYPKYWILKLFKLETVWDKFIEVYDVPRDYIIAGEDYVWFDPPSHFVKFNGVKRVISAKGMERIWDMSFSKLHENYLNAFQQIPEQYATLNNRISGDIKLENIKSSNIQDFEKLKQQVEKIEAMES